MRGRSATAFALAAAAAVAAVLGGCMAGKSSMFAWPIAAEFAPPNAAPGAPARGSPGGTPSFASAGDSAALDDAVALAAERKYAEAETRLAALLPRLEQTADDARTAEAMFWLGFCHEKQGRLATAESFYRRLVDRCGGTKAADQARWRLSRLKPPSP